MNIQATIEIIRNKFKSRLRLDEKWEEDLHPRDENGQFASKNSLSNMSYGDVMKKREELRQKLYQASEKDYNGILEEFKKYDKEIKDRDSAPTKTAPKPEAEKPVKKQKTPSKEKRVKPSESEKAKTARKPEPVKTTGDFSGNAYSEERKNNALWSKNPKEVDEKVRGVASEVWQNSTKEEQKSAIQYTRWSGRFNEKQRIAGAEKDYSAQTKEIEELTGMIDRSSYDFDMRLQRGTTVTGASKFLGIDEDLLKTGGAKELEKRLKGTTPVEFGFTSTGAVDGYGTTPSDEKDYTVQYRIYAPSGTKMMYCEPFSWYNAENDNPHDWWDYNWWDGKSGANGKYSREMEMLLQRGTRYRVTGVSRKKGVLWIDMDVIDQVYDK